MSINLTCTTICVVVLTLDRCLSCSANKFSFYFVMSCHAGLSLDTTLGSKGRLKAKVCIGIALGLPSRSSFHPFWHLRSIWADTLDDGEIVVPGGDIIRKHVDYCHLYPKVRKEEWGKQSTCTNCPLPSVRLSWMTTLSAMAVVWATRKLGRAEVLFIVRRYLCY